MLSETTIVISESIVFFCLLEEKKIHPRQSLGEAVQCFFPNEGNGLFHAPYQWKSFGKKKEEAYSEEKKKGGDWTNLMSATLFFTAS